MELDLQSLFGLHVRSCTLAETPQLPAPPTPRILAHIRRRYWSAKIDDIYLFYLLQPEPVFVNLLRCPGIDSQLAGRYDNSN